jgi:two-component system, OmpR family, sensor histidine kinase CreC
MSLRRRIFIAFAVMMTIAALATGFLLRREARDAYALITEDMMVDTSKQFAQQLGLRMKTTGSLERAAQDWGREFNRFRNEEFKIQILGFEKRRIGIDVYVVDKSGHILFSSRQQDPIGADYSKWRDVALSLQGNYGARASRMLLQGQEVVDYFVGAPILIDGSLQGVVSVIRTRTSLTDFLDLFLNRAAVALALALALLIAFGGLMFLWITRPVERLRNYALRVSKGENPVPPDLPNRELKQLGEAFEEMRISVEGRKTIERFVQSLVHEMKSPLSAMRGSAELVLETSMPNDQRDRFLTNIVEEAHRSEKILEEILRLAAVETLSSLENESKVVLASICSSAENALLPLAAKRNVRFENHFGGDDISVLGDSFLLTQALRNLLQNSIEFSDQGAVIEVRVEASAREIRLRVVDSGSGIPDFARARVFEKFFSLERPSTGRKGSGLGLSFVRDVMRLHGGEVTLEARVGLRGTVAELRFPRG